jgi:hypothetical protein
VPFNSFAEYAPEPVRAQRRSAAVLLRGIWTEFKGDGGMKSKPVPGPGLWFPDHGGECGRRADPLDDHAGYRACSSHCLTTR